MSEHDSFFDELEQAMNTDLEKERSAARPRPDLWQQIRADYDRQSMKRESTMSTAMHTPTFEQFVPMPSPDAGNSMGQYLNAAASIALVLAIAIGGWFATMQLNSPNGSNGAFGLLGQSNATCDVEPMTVDEVMEIVKNPYSGIEWQEGLQPTRVQTLRDLASRELVEDPNVDFDLSILDGNHSVPDQSDFQAATIVADSFLACLQRGTTAQIFGFYDPRTIQGIVLSEYPVFREEEQIRSGVAVLLDYPAAGLVAPYAEALIASDLMYSTNPDRRSAGAYQYSQEYAEQFNASRIIVLGIRVTNANGEVIFENDVDGRSNPVGPLKTTDRMRIVLVKSTIDGEWYVHATIPE